MPKLKIATITLPTLMNDGRTPALEAHAYLQDNLADVFGGYTSWAAAGAWKTPEGDIQQEPVRVYQIAFDPHSTAGQYDAVELIAKGAARRAEQRSIFYTIGSHAFIADMGR